MRAVPHRRFQCNEAIGILSRAGKFIPDFLNGSGADASVPAKERWASHVILQEPPSRWMTALFVQFRFLYANDSSEHEKVLSQFRDLMERMVSYNEGDVVALSHDAGLAIFSGPDKPCIHTQHAIDVATQLIKEASDVNRKRLKHNLSPIRLGIGIDGGLLSSSNCSRHPRLDPGLQPYLNIARDLSELNYQAPFPAVFVSRAVADEVAKVDNGVLQDLGDVIVDNEAEAFTVYAVMGQ